MTHDEAVKTLKNLKDCLNSESTKQALDYAIAVLEREGDAAKKVQEKVQNTDSVEGITQFDERVDNVFAVAEGVVPWGEAQCLLKDMQAHIRNQNAEIRQLLGERLDCIACQRKNALLLEAADKLEKETKENYARWGSNYEESMKIVNRIREEAHNA